MKKRMYVYFLSLLSLLLSLGVARAQTHRSAVGSAEVKLAGSVVRFLPTMQGVSYEASEGAQITVFRPEVAGSVAALSLEWLAVGASAEFEVYAGAKVGGTPLFKSAAGAGQAAWRYFQGDPNQDGGALTVRFDAKKTSYKPKTDGRAGWSATARCVRPETAALAEWKLREEQPQKVMLHADNDSLFLSNILVTGRPATLQRLELAVGEEGVELQSMRLCIGTKEVQGAVGGRVVTFDVTPPLDLPLGWSEISAVANLTSIPAGEEHFSLLPVALQLGDKVQKTRLYPSGVSYAVDRETLPRIVLDEKYEAHATYKVDFPHRFEPALDAKGKYLTGTDELAIVLEPAAGEVVRIDFSEFALDGKAQLRVFYGSDTKTLCAAFSASDNGVGYPLIGRRDKGEGKLLVKFNPKKSNTSSWRSKIGWRARVESVEAEPWRLVNVTTSLWDAKKTPTLYPNEHRVMYKIALQTEGAEGEQPLQRLTLGGENLASLEKLEVYSSIRVKFDGTIDQSRSVKVADLRDINASSFELDFGATPLRLATKGAELVFVGYTASPEKVTTGRLKLFAESYTLVGSTDAVAVNDEGKTAAKYWEIKRALYMKDGEATVDAPIDFYDDGGPNANPKQGFEGTLVLRPATPNARVLVEFKQFALLANKYAPERNDVLEVFSGNGADKKKLWEFDPSAGSPKGFTAVSEADDGTLSIYFKSPNATMAGFTAEVRQLKHEPVKLQKVTRRVWVEHEGKRPLRAGLSGSLMMLNAECDGMQPKAAVKSIKFHVEGVALRAAQVFRFDQSTSRVAELLGKSDVSGQDVEIQLDAPFELKFGTNLFAIAGVADVKANTGDDAVITDVRLLLDDGTAMPLTPPDTETRAAVKNEYELEHPDYAPRELTVGAEWKVKQEGPSYVWETKGGALTLKPAEGESLVALELQEPFDFSASTRHTQTRFAIFSGVDTAIAGKALLDVQTQQKALPSQTVYRPLPGDAELTILFNNHGGNQGLGFLAHVWQEKEKDIELGIVTAYQETDYIAASALPQAFIRLQLPITGNRKPLQLEGLKVTITKGQPHVEKLSILTGGKAFAAASDILVEKLQPQAEETLTLPSPMELLAGDTYLWVALTLKADAPKGSAFDVAVESLTVSGALHTLGEEGNPAGERQIGDFYLFKGDDNVEVDGALQFYDNGGPDKPFTEDAKGTVTFTAKPGNVLVLEVRSLEALYTAKVKIETARGETYEETSAAKLPSKLIAGESLKVTFNPKGNLSKKAGWDMLILSIPSDSPFTVAKAQSSVAARERVLRGESDVPMFRLGLSVEGLRGECKLEQLSLALQDASMVGQIGKLKVWASGKSEYIFNAMLLKEVTPTAEQMDIVLDYTMTEVSEFNFWVTLDVAPGAEIGKKIGLQLVGAKAGSFVYQPSDKPTASCEVKKGVSGTFTVGGASPNFATLTEAVASLEQGVDGPVTFLVRDGEYKERVSLPVVQGTSETNTITIKSESGHCDRVVFTREDAAPARDEGIIAFAGVCHAILEGITVKTGSNKVGSAVSLSNGSSYTTIRNCHLELPKPASHIWSEGGDVLKAISTTKEGTPTINHTLVEGCRVVGGKNGISLNGGQGNVNLSTGRDIIVRNNRVVNGMSKAIYVTDITDFIVEGNRVEASDFTFGYNYQGFDGRRLFGTGRIANNVIMLDNATGIDKFYLEGISLRKDDLVGSVDAPIVVANNIIAIDNARAGGSYGIELGDKKGVGKNIIIAHNTVVLGAGVVNGQAFKLGNKWTNVKVQNNLFANFATTGYALRAPGKDALEGVTLSRNAFWSPLSDKAVRIGKEEKALADLAVLPAYANSIVAQPLLLDFPSDPH